MSAQWLPVLASPKNPNKHLGRKGEITFSSCSFNKTVSSEKTKLQTWPRSIPRSTLFSATVQRLLPDFYLRAAGIGIEFSTRLLLAASKAAVTGAAVRIPAAEIFIYAASVIGFARTRNKASMTEGSRAKQFLLRRDKLGSATCILKDAITHLGLDSFVEVSVHADANGTQIIIIPTGENLISLGVIHDTYVCEDNSVVLDSGKKKANNHVQRYMNSLPAARMRSSASKKTLLRKIEEKCANKAYRAILREAVSDGLASGFESEYQDPKSDSPRIFATGNSLQFMPSWLRQELFPDWFELDFSNMHLSILNARANLQIDLSRSVWDQIFGSWSSKLSKIYAAESEADYEAGLRSSDVWSLFSGPLNSGSTKTLWMPSKRLDLSQIKKALKTSLYSLQFGMDASAARRGFTLDLLELGLGRAEVTVLGNLWSETDILNRIYDGVHQYCSKAGLDARELAIQCQETETALVKIIYEIAGKFDRNKLCITLHSHDGVSVWARSAKIGRKFYKKCKRILGTELSRLGIQSSLEAKGTQPAARTVTACVCAIPYMSAPDNCAFSGTETRYQYSTGPP